MSEPDFLTATRVSYDEVAEAVAEAWCHDLDVKPWDRAVLSVFAELVGPGGRVADVGCGTGRVTGWLAQRGLDVVGIDLSPGMVAVARREHPDLPFVVGDMTNLEIAPRSLDGVLAFYSVIHVPPENLPDVFAGFTRALAPGGHLLVVFQTGDEVVHYSEGYGRTIDLRFHRRTCAEVATLAAGAGLVVGARLEREAVEGHERTPQGYVLARKPNVGIS